MFVTPLPQSNTTWPNAIHQAKNYALAYSINAFALSLFLGASGVTLWSGAAALLFAEKKILDTMTHQILKLLVPIQTVFNFAHNFLNAAWNRTLLSENTIDVIEGATSLALLTANHFPLGHLDNAPHHLLNPEHPENPSETNPADPHGGEDAHNDLLDDKAADAVHPDAPEPQNAHLDPPAPNDAPDSHNSGIDPESPANQLDVGRDAWDVDPNGHYDGDPFDFSVVEFFSSLVSEVGWAEEFLAEGSWVEEFLTEVGDFAELAEMAVESSL